MRGHRVEFSPGFPGDSSSLGDYCKVPTGIDPRPDCIWYLVDPTGHAGAVLSGIHTVTEHIDGTITITPSLVMPGGWHGFLTRGVWT
jgi:hypothetical protein